MGAYKDAMEDSMMMASASFSLSAFKPVVSTPGVKSWRIRTSDNNDYLPIVSLEVESGPKKFEDS